MENARDTKQTQDSGVALGEDGGGGTSDPSAAEAEEDLGGGRGLPTLAPGLRPPFPLFFNASNRS